MCFSEVCNPGRLVEAERVAEAEPVREVSVQIVAGEACPACGQKVTLRAELKKAGRESEYETEKKKRQRG